MNLKKIGKVFRSKFVGDRALVLWKKNLPGRGLNTGWETLTYSVIRCLQLTLCQVVSHPDFIAYYFFFAFPLYTINLNLIPKQYWRILLYIDKSLIYLLLKKTIYAYSKLMSGLCL
jgi:hypothetical protein